MLASKLVWLIELKQQISNLGCETPEEACGKHKLALYGTVPHDMISLTKGLHVQLAHMTVTHLSHTH